MFRLVFPSHVAEVVRRLPPDVKRSVRQALRALCADPDAGKPLRRELEGLWGYRVRRFRIVYAIDRGRRVVQVVGVGTRQGIYEEVAELRRKGPSG